MIGAMDHAAPEPEAAPSLAAVAAVVDRAATDRRRAAPWSRTLTGSSDAALAAATLHARTMVHDDRTRPGWAAAYGRLLEERRAIDRHDDEMRRRVHDGTRDAIARLRRAPSSWALVDEAVRAVCEAGGFTRSLVSAVRGSRWVPLTVHTRDDLDPRADFFRTWVGTHPEIPLANMLGETEMVRRRTAMYFTDPANDRRTFKEIITAAGSPGYAAGPILVGSRTVGFVHVDRVGQGQPMTPDDRDAVGAFAADLGWLFARTSAEEGLGRHAARIDRAMDAAHAALAQAREPTRPPVLGDAVDDLETPAGDAPAGRDALLTGREREILDLVADGATNWAIAQRLTLSEETVKTHLRTIRRKLHVKSRSAAVARYRRLRGGA